MASFGEDGEELTEEQIEKKKKKATRPVRKFTPRLCDMDEEMRADAIEFAAEALEEHKLHKDVTAH
jgi:hypothetical protein